MRSIESNDIHHLIELRGVYDGWSIAVMKDGRLVNRWAEDDGTPAKGYERRWAATEESIALMRSTKEADDAI